MLGKRGTVGEKLTSIAKPPPIKPLEPILKDITKPLLENKIEDKGPIREELMNILADNNYLKDANVETSLYDGLTILEKQKYIDSKTSKNLKMMVIDVYHQ
ncbi:MAG: hypothetical protein JSW18_00520 [Candidatus Omnitrophota bacterium]|nr:MAG: hypothetical protein JSW18_00520 [Candidatus Omnitrophota bacterium]